MKFMLLIVTATCASAAMLRGSTPAQCALSKCASQASACLADAECKTKVTCALACTTESCIDGCAGASPDAATSALVSCAVAQGCVTSSTPVSADATACTNDADTAIWSSKGKTNFNTDMTKCGKKCLGGASCVQGCIKSAEGYSDGCSACFGALGGCTAKNCMAQCIGGQTAACVSCTQAHCVDPFVTCSGIPKSDITPPTTVISVKLE